MPLGGKNRDEELYKAAKSGNVMGIDRLLGSRMKGKGKGSIHKGPKGPSPNIQDSSGMTPLHYAALNGHNDVVQLLLLSNASSHVADHSGSFPIHLAAWKGDFEVTRTLVEGGPSKSNVNAVSDCHETPLHLAAQYGNTRVVEYLLDRHADPRMVNNKGETPLDMAALFGHVDVVRSITRYHPDVLQQGFPLTSPLHLAARNGHLTVISALISAGMDVNTLCGSGSILHEAALFGKSTVVELAMEKGADPRLLDKDGRSVLDILTLYPTQRSGQIREIVLVAGRRDDRRKSGSVRMSCHHDNNSDTPPPVHNPAYEKVVLDRPRFPSFSGLPTLGGSVTGVYYAVARVDYEDLSNQLVLPLRTGGRVQIVGSNSNGTWVGVVDGRRGSFFAAHVDFYQTATEGVKKISCDDIDRDALVPDTTSTMEDIAAARSSGVYAQLRPVTIGCDDSQGYMDVSVATNTLYTTFPVVARPQSGLGPVHPSTNYSNLEQVQFKGRGEDPAQRGATAGGGNTPELEWVSSGYDSVIESGDEVRGSRNFKSALLEDNRESPLSGDLSSSPLLHPRQSDGSTEYLAVSCDPLPPRCYEWSKPSFPKKPSPPSRSLPSPSPPSQHRSLPSPPPPSQYPRVYDNVVLKAKPKKKESDSNSHTDPVDVKRLELGMLNYENVGTILQYGQKNASFGSSLSIPDGLALPTSTSGSKPRPLTTCDSRPHSSYENVSLKAKHKSPDRGVVIQDRRNVFAGLVLASPSHSSTPDRSRLLSVWTGRRDRQAWGQVATLIRSIEGSMECLASRVDQPAEPRAEPNGVEQWLADLALTAHTPTLLAHGFDNLLFLGGSILERADLTDMRIVDFKDQNDVLAAVSKLAAPPDTSRHEDLREWLQGLDLGYLHDDTVANGYTQLSQLVQLETWDVLLGNKGVRIDLLGHQKRFLHCLAQLKAAHPEWMQLKSGPAPRPVGPSYSRSLGTDSSPLHRPANQQHGRLAVLDRIEHLNLSPRPLRRSSIVELRQPSLAQSEAWKLAKEAGLEDEDLDYRDNPMVGHHEEWRHPVNTLLNGFVDFSVQYLGSLLLKSRQLTVDDAVAQLKVMGQGAEPPRVQLSVSWQWVRYAALAHPHAPISEHRPRPLATISEHNMRHVSRCCQDPLDRAVFSYVTNEEGLPLYHAFRADSQELGDDIVMTLGQAFEIGYQKVLTARRRLHSSSSDGGPAPAPPPAPVSEEGQGGGGAREIPRPRGLTDEDLATLDLGPSSA